MPNHVITHTVNIERQLLVQVMSWLAEMREPLVTFCAESKEGVGWYVSIYLDVRAHP